MTQSHFPNTALCISSITSTVGGECRVLRALSAHHGGCNFGPAHLISSQPSLICSARAALFVQRIHVRSTVHVVLREVYTTVVVALQISIPAPSCTGTAWYRSRGVAGTHEQRELRGPYRISDKRRAGPH